MFLLLLIAAFLRFAAQAHRLHDRLATGPAWSFPSQVYSDMLMLEVGRVLPLDYLRAELEARDYRQSDALRAPGQWCRRDDGMDIFLRGFNAPVGGGALAERPERVRLRLASGRLTAIQRLGLSPGHSDGAGGLFLEPVRIATLADSDRVVREWVPLERMARVMREAVIASEDRRFYRHSGIDLRGNARALAINLQAGAVRQGASTITQQLARGMFLGRDRNVLRKFREAVIALALERVFGKDEILEMYLNSVYFGPAEGERVAGVAEAAARFFGVSADALTLEQAALLAGIIPAPGAFSPIDHPERARRQRDRVLRDLVEVGAIDSATARAAMARPLGLKPTARVPDRFPSFVGYVRQELRSRLPAGAAEGWGLTIVSTLDPVWQERAEQALDDGLAAEDPGGRAGGLLEGAFVAIDPATGAVRALVGGRSNAVGDFNRALRARRQPGSAFKPIVYAAALDPSRGAPRFTPGSTVPDLRRSFRTPEGPWTPRNDDDEYHESATLAKGLVHSLNVATSNLVERIGAG
ncbi:MAG: transglycosylase domain-containing protein, partial [Candidatus Rokubacteria bacterium]|nr:transglycosylase domain-containing protein [Candidatus Rokubacteria bacterium]